MERKVVGLFMCHLRGGEVEIGVGVRKTLPSSVFPLSDPIRPLIYSFICFL